MKPLALSILMYQWLDNWRRNSCIDQDISVLSVSYIYDWLRVASLQITYLIQTSMCMSVHFYHTLTHQLFSFRNWNTRCWSVSRLPKNEDISIDKYTATERGIWARSEKNSRPVVYWRSQLARIRCCKVIFVSVFFIIYLDRLCINRKEYVISVVVICTYCLLISVWLCTRLKLLSAF